MEVLARHVVALLEPSRVARTTDPIPTLLLERRGTLLERAVQGAKEQARTQAAQEAGAVGTFEIDVASGTMSVSPEFCRIFGVPVAPNYVASLFEAAVVPEDRAVHSNHASRQDGSAATEVVYRIHRADDGRLRWINRRSRFERNDMDRVVRMVGTVMDITASRLATDRMGALLELGDRLREADTTEAVVGIVAEILGRTLDVDRAGYAVVDTPCGGFRVERDWTAPGTGSLVGNHPLDGFSATIQRLQRGRPLVSADVLSEVQLISDTASYQAIAVRGQITIPIIVAGDLVGVLFAHATEPRAWSMEEVAFAKGVADRADAALAKVRAETEQRMLNVELSHRLKNTLAMVQAIALQTLRPVTEQDAVKAFTSRLLALSKAHDVLLQQSWSAARIRAIVTGVLHGVGQAERFDVDGPDLSFGPRATLSLSLLLHELTTNAVKYGALSNAAGRVSVTWRVEGRGAEAAIHLAWRERDGPPVAKPSRRGFGSRLISMGLVGTGGVTVRYPSSGVEAVMTAPLSQVQQS